MEINNKGNTGERFYQYQETIHENKATQVDKENLGEKAKTMIEDILNLMKENSRIELKGLNKIHRCLLAKWSRKVNCTLKHIRTENITDTNVLIKAVIVYVGKKIDLKACGSKNKKQSEPCWKKNDK